MGFPDATAFAEHLLGHLARVRARYAEIFERVPDLPTIVAIASDQLDFSGSQDVPEHTVRSLRALGFSNIPGIARSVRGWKAGHVRALRSERARELMEQMLPMILGALAAQPQPDAAFGRFDAFISRLPAGVQILSLFQRNPHLMDRVAAVLGAAPTLADHLARHPAALDGLLSPENDPEPSRLLRVRLRDARVLEDAIETIRRTVREEDFNISVATMEGRLNADEAGLRRTKLADSALAALLPRVLADFAQRYGRVRGGGMVVVALGKAGGPRDDGGIRPRPDAGVRAPSRGDRKPRGTPDSGEPMVRPRGSRLHRRAHWTRRGWAALCGRYAPSPLGQ